MCLAHLGIVAATLLGWADVISLQPSKGDRTLSAWHKSIGGLDHPSERTEETLRRYDLKERYRKDPVGALKLLERNARRNPEPELIYGLAELSWIEGQRAEGRRRNGGAAALDHYTDTVAYAFDYLFDPELAHGRSPTDPRFRLACDLYNAALDRLIRASKTKDGLRLGETTLKIHGSEQIIRLALWRDTPWEPSDVHELIPASDFEVTGLDSRSRRYGLGVPLIAVRRSDAARKGQESFYPPEMAFPLTAILRPNRPLRDAANANVDEIRACTIDLVDPVQSRVVGRGAEAIPIEADVTTPLAYMWSRTDLSKFRWTGLLRPGDATDRAGLMLIRPYESSKIPVVMVHGLASSPLAWIPMLNELLRDPQIQQNYQFLLYVYPTGVPIPIAAAGLRDALNQARTEFDPTGQNPRFSRMVLLGHSMGGLLSHAMAVDSGNRFWELNTDRRFDDILGPPEVLAELRHYSFFKPLPYVKRVVFLATPHRGSEYSRGFVGRVGSGLISEPDHYTKLLNQLLADNPDAFPRRFRHLPTSIETLEPDSPVLLALLKMQPNPEVRFHSIIGSLRPEGVASTTDGIVPYRSAHLDGPLVESERVVRSDHGVQKDPEAIREVRRILLKHLAETPPRLAPSGIDAGPGPR